MDNEATIKTPSTNATNSNLNTKQESIKEELELAPNLKCMPFIATEIIRMIDDPQTTSRELRSLISTDASLAARVLRLVNSAQFALTRKVTELGEAVSILGFNQVREVILLASTEVMRGDKGAQELFRFNLLAGNLAKALCKNLDPSLAGEAFVAGLMQGVGRSFLLERYPEEYSPLLLKNNKDLVEQEKLIFGFQNNFIASELISGWELSASLANAAKNMYIKPGEFASELEISIHFAVALSQYNLDDGIPNDYLMNLDRNALEQLGFRPPELRAVFEQAYEEFGKTMSAFNEVL